MITTYKSPARSYTYRNAHTRTVGRTLTDCGLGIFPEDPIIYVFGIGGRHKVGVTRSFHRRIEEYRQHAYEVDVVAAWLVMGDLFDAERIMVARLNDYACPLRSEWFSLPPRVVRYLSAIKDIDASVEAWKRKVLVCI